MNTRPNARPNAQPWGPLAAVLLAGALLLGSAGVTALAAAAMGPRGTNSTPSGAMGGYGPMMGSTGPTGPTGPMGGYGPGGMMGGNWPGMGHGMMGGYGPGSQGQAPASSTPTTGAAQVTIQNLAFVPANISVPVGTTVTWTNQDSTPHTVTFRNGMQDSGMLRQGQSFRYTFTDVGAVPYYCAYHPNMTGTVTVTS